MEKKRKLGKKAAEALRGPLAPLKTARKLTPGGAIRIYRETQGLSQADLAEKSGLTQATISGLETDRLTLGIDRAKMLARALRVHPAAIAFPSWDVEKEGAA